MSSVRLLDFETSSNFGDFADGEPCILGIDEAGRGPVLGPMVYACAVTPKNTLNTFDLFGFMDSKCLNDKKRTLIFNQMNEKKNRGLVCYCLVEISARYLSSQMLNRRVKKSLNEISHDAAIGLIINALKARINVTEVYVDTVGPKETYKALLQSKFPGLQITVSEKADSLFSVVSAASIVAKVTRDERLKNFVFMENHLNEMKGVFGSGYPGDAVTRKYLLEHVHPVFGFNSIVRYSWKPAIKALERGAINCTWMDLTNQQKISSFFQITSGNRMVPRSKYFKARKLSSAVDF